MWSDKSCRFNFKSCFFISYIADSFIWCCWEWISGNKARLSLQGNGSIIMVPLERFISQTQTSFLKQNVQSSGQARGPMSRHPAPTQLDLCLALSCPLLTVLSLPSSPPRLEVTVSHHTKLWPHPYNRVPTDAQLERSMVQWPKSQRAGHSKPKWPSQLWAWISISSHHFLPWNFP